jgi:GNAT superfamily N-acetyltransferase
MKDFIRNRIREGVIREFIDSFRINDVDDDELYDNLISQADDLSKNSEIGFGAAGLFGVLINTENKELVGATWLESSGNFTFHIIIKPEYRGKGLSKLLLDDLMTKYTQMKSYVGNDYKVVVNVVNDKLATTLQKHYGFKTMEDNGSGGVIMSN